MMTVRPATAVASGEEVLVIGSSLQDKLLVGRVNGEALPSSASVAPGDRAHGQRDFGDSGVRHAENVLTD
jgi:hypothetical protein